MRYQAAQPSLTEQKAGQDRQDENGSRRENGNQADFLLMPAAIGLAKDLLPGLKGIRPTGIELAQFLIQLLPHLACQLRGIGYGLMISGRISFFMR